MSLWKEYVGFTSEVLGMPRSNAAVICVVSMVMLLAMLAQTWFIWVGLIVTFVTVLAILLILEYSLRAWYAVRDGIRPPVSAAPVSSTPPIVRDRMAAACADAQGRIEKGSLRGYDVNAMAEQILRKACIRKIWSPRPSWLSFPAISRAMPRLAEVGRMLKVMLTR